MPYLNSSEVEAVNTMLGAVGESPISSLDAVNIGLSIVSIAQTVLNNTSRQVQASGYEFNSEENYPLAVDSDGLITVPINVLKIDSSDTSDHFVVRSGKLYNKTTHTSTFEKAILVDVVWFLPFTDLPQTARDYIVAKAAREFQMQILKSAELDQVLAGKEQLAYLEFFREEIDAGDYNIFDSQDTSEMLTR